MENEQISTADLGEMLGLVYISQDAGCPKVQLNTEHAAEILERLIAFEKQRQAH